LGSFGSQSEVFMQRQTFIGGASAAAIAVSATKAGARGGSESDTTRAQTAYERRVAAAAAARSAFRASSSNGDEARFAQRGFAASYTKGLPHDANGRVDSAAFAALRSAVAALDPDRLDPRTSPRLRELIARTLTRRTCPAGCDPLGIALDPPARIDSDRTARDALELAWLALARDVPFAVYDTDPVIGAAAAELGVPPHDLFRPAGASGPPISQLALVDIERPPFGALAQRHDPFVPQRDFLVTRDAWLAAQNGTPAPTPALQGRRRYLSTQRDLAAWVRKENSFGDVVAVIDALPPDARTAQWNPVDVLGVLGLATGVTAIATFHQKFAVHRRLRPEELFGLIEFGRTDVGLAAALAESVALARLRAKNGSALLPQTYPAGAPQHPSYPAAHASFAGAAATVIKAYARGEFAWIAPVIPTADGDALLPYSGATLTLAAEIDKFAANYAYGRHAAGVHYRSDSDAGLRFGEAIALSVLRDIARVSGPETPTLTLTTFDGEPIAIESA